MLHILANEKERSKERQDSRQLSDSSYKPFKEKIILRKESLPCTSCKQEGVCLGATMKCVNGSRRWRLKCTAYLPASTIESYIANTTLHQTRKMLEQN